MCKQPVLHVPVTSKSITAHQKAREIMYLKKRGCFQMAVVMLHLLHNVYYQILPAKQAWKPAL
jgi:hypothetical protein